MFGALGSTSDNNFLYGHTKLKVQSEWWISGEDESSLAVLTSRQLDSEGQAMRTITHLYSTSATTITHQPCMWHIYVQPKLNVFLESLSKP